MFNTREFLHINYRKKYLTEKLEFVRVGSDPLFPEVDPDPVPYQNEADPKNCSCWYLPLIRQFDFFLISLTVLNYYHDWS